MAMKWNKQKSVWIALFFMLAITESVKYFPAFIEHFYSAGIYPFIGSFLRILFGWIPFSVGDLLVGILIGYVIFRLVKAAFHLAKKGMERKGGLKSAAKAIQLLLIGYIVFNFMWGFNYYRLGSSYLMDLDPIPYSTEEVDTLVAVLQKRLHTLSLDSVEIEKAKTNNRELLSTESVKAFHAASSRYPFLKFKHASLKPNLIGKMQGYMGYAGYLFPFTGEAHVNFYAPSYSLPFSVCHEMAHQLGFGAESEANLIGFLAAGSSSHKAFEYSAYVGVHAYALRELYLRDTVKAKTYQEKMPRMVKKDRLEMKRFLEAHESFLQPGLDMAYNWYLLSQNQEQGLASYNYVVAWLIAFGKKFGWERI
jgi:hypothetical protein